MIESILKILESYTDSEDTNFSAIPRVAFDELVTELDTYITKVCKQQVQVDLEYKDKEDKKEINRIVNIINGKKGLNSEVDNLFDSIIKEIKNDNS